MRALESKPPFGIGIEYSPASSESPYLNWGGRNKLWEKSSDGEHELKHTLIQIGALNQEEADNFFKNQISPRASLVFFKNNTTYRLSRLQMGFEWTPNSWDFQRAYILEKHGSTEGSEIPDDSIPTEVSAIKVSHSDPHIYAYRVGKLFTDSKEAKTRFQGMLRLIKRGTEIPWIATP